MADMNKIAGVQSCTISREGAAPLRVKVADSANYRLSGVDRETLIGATGVAGYKEMPVQGFIEVGCFEQRDLSFGDMVNWSDVTTTLYTKSGKIIICRGWLVTTPEPAANDGTFTLRFEGAVDEVFE
jgi:hypothetical protein